MKVLRLSLLVFAVLLIILVVVFAFFLGDLIKTSVETVGPKVTGVEMTLGDAKVYPFRGHVTLKELIIGNPEGFKSDYLFRLGALEINVNVKSVTSNTIVIENILIRGPIMNYEKSLTTSNLGTLLASLEGESADEEKDKEQPAEKKEKKREDVKGGKKIVINDLQIEGIRVKVSTTLTGGHAITIPLPPIHMTDIGKESEGASLTDVLLEIVRAIFGAVTKGVTGSVKLVGKGAMLVGETALDGVQLAGEGALKAGEVTVDGVKVVGGTAVDGVQAVGGVAVDGAQLAGKGALKAGEVTVDGVKVVGGAAVDGVQAVGGAAVGGAKVIGGAAMSGTKKIFGGMRNLVTSDEETDE